MIVLKNRFPARMALSGLGLAAILALGRQPAVAASGTAANVCVALSGSNGQVVGLQLDMTWASSCMTADQGGATCTANGATGKDVHSSLLNNSSMRALFFSMSDQSPIPDGEIFCCRFSALNSPLSPCCSMNLGNMIFSGAGGQRVTSGPSLEAFVNGALCAASSGGGSQQQPPAGAPPLNAAGGAPVVSVPGGAPAGGVPAAPAGGSAPAPAGGGAVPRVVQGIPPAPEQAPEAVGEATPGEAVPPPTSAVVGRPAPTAFPTARRTPTAAATPTVKVPTLRSTPTAATSPTPAGTTTPRKHKRHRAKPTPESK
jgi:hypothetical protein